MPSFFPAGFCRAESAAGLHTGAPRHALQHGGHRVLVVAGAESAVQVHDVDPARPLDQETLRNGSGVVPINGLPRLLTLTEANNAAATNVDGWKEIH